MGVVGIVEEVEVKDNNFIVLFEDWIDGSRDFLSSRKQGLYCALSGVMLLVIGGRSDLFLEFIVGWWRKESLVWCNYYESCLFCK